jgi:bifunctional ADP-heptose synthase (sugar kinase/adenylyltransferase)
MVHIIGSTKETRHSKDELLLDPKIQSVDVVGDSVHFLRRQKPLVKIGVYVGRFPCITPKDAVFLSLCRTKCDMLIILLESDYSVRLKQEQSLVQHTAKERAFTVASLPFVDWVCLYDEEGPDLAINKISPSMIFHGLYSNDEDVISVKKDILQKIEHPFPLENRPKKALSLKYFDIPTKEGE